MLVIDNEKTARDQYLESFRPQKSEQGWPGNENATNRVIKMLPGTIIILCYLFFHLNCLLLTFFLALPGIRFPLSKPICDMPE